MALEAAGPQADHLGVTYASSRPPYVPIQEATDSSCTSAIGDYYATRATFNWEEAAQGLDLPSESWNIAREAADRPARENPERIALRWLPKVGDPLDVTYSQLARETFRFASALDALGVRLGSTVFILTNRIPEL